LVSAISGPFRVVLDDRDVESPGAIHGVDLAVAGLGALERVGLACDGVSVLGAPGVYAAGDVRAAQPRTVLEALESGIAAARAAADNARGDRSAPGGTKRDAVVPQLETPTRG
jgi:pyruvate/2-oxoglutarate dehydrogenase complex dihydrolipoamide dehydrogenase (E3) component